MNISKRFVIINAVHLIDIFHTGTFALACCYFGANICKIAGRNTTCKLLEIEAFSQWSDAAATEINQGIPTDLRKKWIRVFFSWCKAA